MVGPARPLFFFSKPSMFTPGQSDYDEPPHSLQCARSAASCLITCSTTGPVMRKTVSLFLLLLPGKLTDPVYNTRRSITKALQW